MKEDMDFLQLVTSDEVLLQMGAWIRLERQRLKWKQSELARRSNVPASTISRLERTGLASTDALMRILFALNRLDEMARFLHERLRYASLPQTLHTLSIAQPKPVQRVRRRKDKENV
jgi:transcriptional regulator with XRE-family HTH domain